MQEWHDSVAEQSCLPISQLGTLKDRFRFLGGGLRLYEVSWGSRPFLDVKHVEVDLIIIRQFLLICSLRFKSNRSLLDDFADFFKILNWHKLLELLHKFLARAVLALLALLALLFLLIFFGYLVHEACGDLTKLLLCSGCLLLFFLIVGCRTSWISGRYIDNTIELLQSDYIPFVFVYWLIDLKLFFFVGGLQFLLRLLPLPGRLYIKLVP